MNLLLSDTPLAICFPQEGNRRYIDLSGKRIANCIGCFGCWTKTPGKCVIRDDATQVYPVIAQSRKVIYVSRIRFGTYDTIMKTMLERAIPIQKAWIRLHNGETHHAQRDVVPKDATVIAYGDSSPEEKELFRRLVGRNAHNMSFASHRVLFAEEPELETLVQQEVEKWES